MTKFDYVLVNIYKLNL